MTTAENDTKSTLLLEEERLKGLRATAITHGVIMALIGAGLFIYGLWHVETTGSRYHDANTEFGYLDPRTFAANVAFMRAQVEEPYYLLIGASTGIVGLCTSGYSPPGLPKKSVARKVEPAVDKP